MQKYNFCIPAKKADFNNSRYAYITKNQRFSQRIAGVSRKFLIPLLEYFDSKHLTIRVGDIRKLSKK